MPEGTRKHRSNVGFERLTGYAIADIIGRTPGSVLQDPMTDASDIDIARTAVREEREFASRSPKTPRPTHPVGCASTRRRYATPTIACRASSPSSPTSTSANSTRNRRPSGDLGIEDTAGHDDGHAGCRPRPAPGPRRAEVRPGPGGRGPLTHPPTSTNHLFLRSFLESTPHVPTP